MLVSLIRQWVRDRRGATAVAMAILLVPMILAAGAAIDLARIASVRTLLQASVDSAAIAGVSEWQMSESSTNAYNIANNEFNNTGSQLSRLAASSTVTITLACTGTTGGAGQGSNQCGTPGQPYVNTSIGGCPAATSFEYCVVVSATLTLNNSIMAAVLPSEVLTVRSSASAPFASSSVAGKDIPPSPGFGSAGDKSGIYAYAVPMSSSGSANYGELPVPNSYCSSASGPLQFVPETSSGTGVTACNYLFISDSLGDAGTGGSISLASNQPISFAFINDTGANGYTGTATTSTSNLMISTTSSSAGYSYYQNGLSIVTSTPTTCTYGQANCVPSKGSSTQLYGNCPAHTLYGSLDINFGGPTSDSLNEYSSAYEVLGNPPTYYTNHVLTPFVVNSSHVVTQTVNGTTYYVKAVCPNYSTDGTAISAPLSSSYTSSSLPSGQNFTGLNVFSTYFPTGKSGTQFTAFQDDATSIALTGGTVGGTTNIYPPAVGGCTPATNALDGGVTPASDDPWWGWNSSNISNCTGSVAQTTNYSNCALLIQPLGTGVPVNSNNQAIMPDYYNVIEATDGTILALDPVWDGITYTDLLTGAIVNNTDAAGYFPPNSTATSQVITNATTIHGGGTATPYANSAFVGDLLVVQTPSTSGVGQDHNPPLMTSHKCYDPSVALKDGGYMPSNSTTDLLGYYPYTNNGITIPLAFDPVANPQLGAVTCNTNPPSTYAFYWNDLGTYGSDDLGYWNAVESFTCSVPSASNQGAGAPTISD